jgi:two-component system OmpR family sensor kinase
MNNLEKKSFYSFLALYIISSFLFLALIGYWYYRAQKNALENETYYKLQHITDVKSGDIIMAHMKNKKLKKLDVPKGISLALIDTKANIVEGKLVSHLLPKKAAYLTIEGYNIFVSDAPREHLGIKYVVAQSNGLYFALHKLQTTVLSAMIIVALLLAIIAWILSKLFMKPVRQRVEQIERFINDVTHELNTPITALSMATNQALKQEKCTQKTLKNISISTKQLYDIYSSLTYLNFSDKEEQVEVLDIAEVLQKSIAYYSFLCESKRIKVQTDLKSHSFMMPQAQLKLLFGNLIGNAIKYSPANSTLKLSMKEGIFRIQDEGIGIDPDKQDEIFKKFNRATEYSGGFGVGLSIVKSICDNYSIGLSLDSTPDVGTEFRLDFNLK